MILYGGRRYPSQEQNRLLDGLEDDLNATLAHGSPPGAEMVIAACEALGERALAGAFDSELEGLGLDAALLAGQVAQVAALMGRESLEAKVREELGDGFAVPRTVHVPGSGERLVKRVVPLGVLFHIAAGNVDGLPAFTVAEGLLAGNVNILKLPSADNGLSLRMLEELVKVEPRLAPYVYVFDTPSDDVGAMVRMAGLADGIVVWGGDGATQAVRKLAPPGVKLIEWGHKLSFAYATPAGLSDGTLEALARHVMETRQLLCSSCQTLFLDSEDLGEAETLCRRMVPFLERAAQGAAPLDVGSRAQVTLRLYTDRLEEQAGHTARRTFRGKGCSVRLCEEGGPELSPQFGNLLVKPLPRARLVAALRGEKGYLQTAGLLCGPEERAELVELLFRAGVVRVTGAGSMSHTTALDAHDGEYPLRRYTRVVEERE